MSCDGSWAPAITITFITQGHCRHNILQTYEINSSFGAENQSKKGFFMQETCGHGLKRLSGRMENISFSDPYHIL